MLHINKKWLALGLILLGQACTQMDNYMLGKDNTPAPKELKPIKTKVNVVEQWSAVVGQPQRSGINLKLKPEINGQTIYTADASGLVQAVNKNNGQLVWAKKLSYGLVSGPTVAAGKLVVSTDISTVVLLAQADGRELWTVKVSSEVLSKPVIADSKVIAKTIDGHLYAFDLTTGKRLWLSEHGAPSLILKASSSPAIIDNKLALTGYSDGRMDAVDIASGRLVWQRSIAFASGASDVERLVDIDADPVVRGDVVYLASYQGYIGALSLKDGQFIWRKPASVYRNISVDSDAIYYTDSRDVVWSVQRHTGQVNWKQIALKARGLTEPVLMGNRLIVGDNTGLLHVLSTSNGALLSRVQMGSAISAAPVAAGNHVYVMAANGKLSRLSVG